MVRLTAGLLALGAAIPCLAVSVAAAALQDVQPADGGVGSGLITTFQWVGGALGFAVVTAIAGDPHAGGGAEAAGAVHRGLLACAALCLVALAVTLVAICQPRAAAAAARVTGLLPRASRRVAGLR